MAKQKWQADDGLYYDTKGEAEIADRKHAAKTEIEEGLSSALFNSYDGPSPDDVAAWIVTNADWLVERLKFIVEDK